MGLPRFACADGFLYRAGRPIPAPGGHELRYEPPGAPVSLPPRDEQDPAPRGALPRQARVLARGQVRMEGRELAVVRVGDLLGGPRRDGLPVAADRACA